MYIKDTKKKNELIKNTEKLVKLLVSLPDFKAPEDIFKILSPKLKVAIYDNANKKALYSDDQSTKNEFMELNLVFNKYFDKFSADQNISWRASNLNYDLSRKNEQLSMLNNILASKAIGRSTREEMVTLVGVIELIEEQNAAEAVKRRANSLIRLISTLPPGDTVRRDEVVRENTK